MLQQIGQDMTMTEQQLKIHNLQTKKTVQLKRVKINKLYNEKNNDPIHIFHPP